MAEALARPELISLAAGFVDQATLPVEALREAAEELFRDTQRARQALQYGLTPGDPALREFVLQQFAQADRRSLDELHLSLDQVIMTAGSNQLLYHLSEILFDAGDIVLCTSPTYFVYLGVLQNLGVRAIGIEMDADGLIPEALEAELTRLDAAGELGRVKALYLVDYFDNPSNVTLSLERRPQIVEIIRRWSQEQRIHILEDAAYRALRYSGPDLPSLRSFDPDGETVIVAQTFSKSFSPGLRVGAGLLPKSLVEPLCQLKGHVNFGAPNLAQQLLAEVFRRGLYEPQVARLQTAYREKLNATLQAADEFLAPLPGVHYERPQGGLYLWLTLPPNVDAGPEGKLFGLALEEGILYVPGQYCYPADSAHAPRSTIRLSYGVQPPHRLRQGIQALARALQRLEN